MDLLRSSVGRAYVLVVAGLLLLSGFVLDVNQAAADTDSLYMGIFPRRNAQQTVTAFQPLADYLSRELKRDVRLVTAKDFKQFWKGVQEKRFDIVHFNQLHYIESHTAQGYEVIASNEEFGASTIAGAVAVRKSSEFTSLSDLKGKRILFGGDKKAMISYIVNTVLLRRAGLQAGDYTEVFAKNPPNAIIAVHNGFADAAGIGDVGLRLPVLAKSGIDANNLQLLATSEPLPHLPWAVRGELGADLRLQIQKLLVDLKSSEQGPAILKSAGLSAIHKAMDADYDAHRKIINEFKQSQ